ncbi:MAG: family 10 glycosylhydrolase [bacterium]|nr:family 10 glycosylhydrolase [bacterium]
MIKKVFSYIFIFLMLFCGKVFAHNIYEQFTPQDNEIIFNQNTYRYDIIDPKASTNTKGMNYPGLRGANQLVIYTSEFGNKTNTNEFGTEAIITDGIVTSLSGADSLIPENGIVISGHGKAKTWINENVMVGAKIYIDTENHTITSYITSETFLYTAQEKVKEVQNMLLYYTQTCACYNPKRTELNLEKAKDYILKAQKNANESQKYSTKAIEYANEAMSTVVPFNSEELKGVWIRPEYYTRKNIEQVLDTLQDAGINNVFIETYYHGKTIFPSRTMEKYGFIKQYEDYMGFDPLKIWISEAHRRGIKVHVWFQTFYVGNKSPETNPEYILAKRPQWANYQKKNVDSSTLPYSVSEHNGYFLDPANPEVQSFLYELLCEIVTKYRPDGINLDYIRYPQSVAPNFANYDMSNWGYTPYARMDFKETYGVDPIELKQSDPLWNCWRYYRMGKVTDFVKKASNLCRANKVMLTAVIFPNRHTAMDTKMQDWKTWSINNFVDGFTPLFLTCDDKTAAALIEEVLKNKSSSTRLYAGLFVTFMNGSNTDLIKQIHAARRYNLQGIIIFDYAHFGETYINTLTESILKPLKKEFVITEEDIPRQQKMVQFKIKNK